MNTHTVITHTVVNIPYQHSSRDHTSGLTPPSTRDIGHQWHLPPLCRFERLTTLLSPMFTFIRCLVISLILLTVFLNMSLLYIINSFFHFSLKFSHSIHLCLSPSFSHLHISLLHYLIGLSPSIFRLHPIALPLICIQHTTHVHLYNNSCCISCNASGHHVLGDN